MDERRIRNSRGHDAAAALFEDDGWQVEHEFPIGNERVDLFVKKGRSAYLVEIKSISEGRADRVIPLLSQAILQAQLYARHSRAGRPLALIYVDELPPSLIRQVERFAGRFAQDVAVGIVSGDGNHYLIGEGLEELARRGREDKPVRSSKARPSIDLFSDLNQWMLKVLLAPEIPPRMLSAPRLRYRNASELAVAADVSVMSAFRLVQQLRQEGFISESHGRIALVRLEHLFRRWRAVGQRRSSESPMRALIPKMGKKRFREIIAGSDACLALFAAAEEFRLGHVSGVPMYVYVRKLSRLPPGVHELLVPAAENEAPDVIIRQPLAPKSVFRGAVELNGARVSDILQVWLDVSVHPSRGQEQAEVIRRKALANILGRSFHG